MSITERYKDCKPVKRAIDGHGHLRQDFVVYIMMVRRKRVRVIRLKKAAGASFQAGEKRLDLRRIRAFILQHWVKRGTADERDD